MAHDPNKYTIDHLMRCLLDETRQTRIIASSILSETQAIITPVSPTQEVITAAKTYTNFKSLAFTVYDGTADVTVGGVTLTYPLGTSVLGANWEDDNLTGAITITPTGSTLVTTILKL